MVSGNTSNFNDSGYNVSGQNLYDVSNNLVSSAISSSDLYNTTQTFGIIMFDGSTASYPIYCSVSNMTYIAAVNDSDDFYIVYPGWGFTLYNATNYNTTDFYSKTYINNTTKPVIFMTAAALYGISANIYQSVNTTDVYPANNTASIKVYFRNQEITISGIS